MSKLIAHICGCTGSTRVGISHPCALHWKPGDNPDLEPTPEAKENAERWAKQMREDYYRTKGTS